MNLSRLARPRRPAPRPTTTAPPDWDAKLFEAKLELSGGATGERLDDGTLTTRSAIHARIVNRFKLDGYHTLAAFGELGAGTADGPSVTATHPRASAITGSIGRT